MSSTMTQPPAPQFHLSETERNPKSIGANGTLLDAVNAFQSDTDLRLLPLLGRTGAPVGAIFEKDVRNLLLNPFGHALLRNPTINSNLAELRRACPMMELSNDIGALVEHYRKADGREGMILTVGGRLHATLTNRRLLLLAAEHEHHAARERLKRAERIAEAGSPSKWHGSPIRCSVWPKPPPTALALPATRQPRWPLPRSRLATA